MIETIAAGLGAAKSAIDIVKSVREAESQLESAELKARMAEVYSALADVRMALTDAESLIVEKDKALQALRDTLSLFKDTVEIHGLQYRVGENENPIGNPYCPICSMDDGKAVLTHKHMNGVICPRCKSDFPRTTRFPDPLPNRLASPG